MRYFTQELLRALSGDPKGQEAWAAAEWARRSETYRAELASIENQLPEALRHFVREISLHENHLEQLTVGGKEADTLITVRNKLELVLQLSDALTQKTLTYKKVFAFSFSANESLPLLQQSNEAQPLLTDTWLYDEISLVTLGRFRHRILLASGGMLSIEFGEFSYQQRSNSEDDATNG